MQVERFVCGRVRSNAYLVADDEGRALLVDAGAGAAAQVIARVEELGCRPAAVVLTHGHPDHIWTARHLSDRFDVPTYIHRDDLSWFTDPATGGTLAFVRLGGRALGRVRRIRPRRLRAVEDEERIAVDGFDVDVLHTPGHSRGSACLRVGDVCFAGDTVFRGGIGRAYLGGDIAMLRRSVEAKLLPLPDDVRLFPGHGPSTSVAEERSVWERLVGGG